ncbi:chromatin modification-related protein Eaf3p [[Candida] railenensis]|uniref:Chromatin modification-related protein EAF3 n=1 Tax=[Candida] railenensis TaxID=45579 RepID=A0A9P0QNI1_9ASCO|nr:chromatin modification-related protein Eaf3p [[Candida] railenensis]
MIFAPGSKLLAYHGPLIYEAKVLLSFQAGNTFVEDSEGKHLPVPDKLGPELRSTNAYFLHYKGWKPKWDEWVEQSRVMEWNEENVKIQKELKQKLTRPPPPPSPVQPPASQTSANSQSQSTLSITLNGKRTSASTSGTGNSNNKTRPTSAPPSKRKRTSNSSAPASASSSTSNNSHHSSSSNSSSVASISLPISSRIKYILVDDWENISKEKTLVSIPSAVPVSTIIADYRSHKINRNPENSKRSNIATLDEILSGLEQYFNKSLGLILLYKFERLQYLKVLNSDDLQGKPMSSIYGVEHLLRLFTALPGLIAQTTMDPVSINTLIDECKELLEYIDENLGNYTNGYVNVSPNYENLAH